METVMSRLWVVRESIPDFVTVKRQFEEDETVAQSFCTVENAMDVMLAGFLVYRNPLLGMPTLKIQFESETFDWDFFTWHKLVFVSEQMREVMAIDPADVRFHDIDYLRSPQTPRSKKYQVMELMTELSVVDGPLFEAEFEKEMQRLDAQPGKLAGPLSLILRQDVTPTHELFYDDHYGRLLCTDAFAVRILNSGCKGIAFADPAHLYGPHCRFRTLQGVEEYVSWSRKKMKVEMKLVEAIR